MSPSRKPRPRRPGAAARAAPRVVVAARVVVAPRVVAAARVAAGARVVVADVATPARCLAKLAIEAKVEIHASEGQLKAETALPTTKVTRTLRCRT